MKPVPTLLNAAIIHHGINISELARRIGMNDGQLYDIRNGMRKLPVHWANPIIKELPILSVMRFDLYVMEQYYDGV